MPTIAEHALQLIEDGQTLGLGTGRAAADFIRTLGERVRAGLRVRGVPTSLASADLAREVGIPLTTLEEVDFLDIAFDGADQVDPQLRLLKGLGGAMVREKIVAAAARRFVVLVGSEKLVEVLGDREGVIPVEVVPFGLATVRRRLEALGLNPQLRLAGDRPLVTDNANHILDCRCGPLKDPAAIEAAILGLPGVVGTGLFLDMTRLVLVQQGDQVRTMSPTG